MTRTLLLLATLGLLLLVGVWAPPAASGPAARVGPPSSPGVLAPTGSLPSMARAGPWLPDPVSFSALGDSITPAYDADANPLHLGPQPWYSYATGNVSSIDSFYQRLLRVYPNGTGPSLQAHLLAVPGDKAIDMVWQSLYAVQNRSGFVSVLIGGNDVCHSGGGLPTPTPVWNFSTSLNRTFTILRNDLPPSTVIALGNVVDVPLLWTLFGGDSQAQLVWQNTCPALLTAGGRAMMQYMIGAYNHMEAIIARAYNVDLWDIGNLTFSAEDVNHLDFFHPSLSGQQEIAAQWWAALPYAAMFPRFTGAPALPTSVPVATSLSVKVGIADPTPLSADLTYKETGAFFWATVPLVFQSGSPYNGTYGTTLPFNATAVAGTLQLYLTASDVPGYVSASPATAPAAVYTVTIAAPGNSSGPPLASVSVTPASLSLDPGGSLTLSATALAQDGSTLATGVAYAWGLTPGGVGQLIPLGDGSRALFVAGEAAGSATVTVVATSGVLNVSSTSSVVVAASPPRSHEPPPSPGPSPLAVPVTLPNLGLVVLIVPAAFLAAMAGLGLLLRRRYLRGSAAARSPRPVAPTALSSDAPSTTSPDPAAEADGEGPEHGPGPA